MGIITASYTHTYDIFLFKARRIMYGVSKSVVHVLPRPKGIENQLKLVL